MAAESGIEKPVKGVIGPRAVDIVSDDTKALKDLLQSCDDSLVHQQRLDKLKDEELSAREQQVKVYSEAQSPKGSGILESPLTFFLLGMVTTAITVNLVKP